MSPHNPAKKEFYHSTMWIEDSILYCTYKPNLVINLEVAQDIVEDRAKLCAGRKSPILLDCSELVYIDQAAREFMASQEACEHVTAIALISNTTYMKIIAKALVLLDKTTVSMIYFNNRHEAQEWLHNFTNCD